MNKENISAEQFQPYTFTIEKISPSIITNNEPVFIDNKDSQQ